MKRSKHAPRSSHPRGLGPYITAAIGISFGLVIIGFILLTGRNESSSASSIIQFNGTTLNNTPISLSDLRGQVVMVNFWATWCPPCRAEMPTIVDAYRAYHEQGFTVLAVNASESPESIRPFVQQLGIPFPVILDQSETIQRQFGIDSFPTSLFIDANGALYATHNGAISPTQLKSTIETGLARRQ